MQFGIGDILIQQLMRKFNADDETSELASELVGRFAHANDKEALLKAMLKAALDVQGRF